MEFLCQRRLARVETWGGEVGLCVGMRDPVAAYGTQGGKTAVHHYACFRAFGPNPETPASF